MKGLFRQCKTDMWLHAVTLKNYTLHSGTSASIQMFLIGSILGVIFLGDLIAMNKQAHEVLLSGTNSYYFFFFSFGVHLLRMTTSSSSTLKVGFAVAEESNV